MTKSWAPTPRNPGGSATANRSSRVAGGRARRRQWWRSLVRAASWHRRGLAAVAAALAVLTGVSAAVPDGPATTRVVTAASGLPGGSLLSGDDLEVRELVAADLPDGVLPDPGPLVGRTLAAPVAEGQPLTELVVVSARTAARPGRVVAPVRLADPGLAPLVNPGDLIDVIGADNETGQARVVAPGVRVVTVPVPDEETAGVEGGALVLVEVTSTTATDLARAAAGGPLTLTWRST